MTKKLEVMNNISRRDFLKATAFGTAALTAPYWTRAEVSRQRPNILFIITDQQHAGMLGCAGNPYVKTPNLDRLAAGGVQSPVPMVRATMMKADGAPPVPVAAGEQLFRKELVVAVLLHFGQHEYRLFHGA